jgi:hypothetical protein
LGIHGLAIQPIEALTSILEVEPLLKEIGIFQPPQGIPHGPGGQIGLIYDILLSKKAA